MKEKLAKVKSWAKENWMYIAGGAATVAAVGLAIWKGLKTDNSVIDPMVIDKGRDDWMDQLTTGITYENKDRPLTVREIASIAVLDEKALALARSKKYITDEQLCEINDEIIENPENAWFINVLDNIEGFWRDYEPTEEVQGS